MDEVDIAGECAGREFELAGEAGAVRVGAILQLGMDVEHPLQGRAAVVVGRFGLLAIWHRIIAMNGRLGGCQGRICDFLCDTE